MGNRRFFLFLVFVFADYAVRGDEYPCSGACAPTERSVFKVGHTYVYEYTAYGLTRVNISDSGQLNRNVSLTLSSELEIYVLSPCDLILKLQKVDLKSMTDGHADQDIDESKLKEFVKVLTENSVQIHYRNGSIPEICVHEDPTWALNIKRGIVSMLQYSWEDANYTQIETDILGSCEHQYTSTEVDDWRVIKKKSNLNRCITRGSNVLLNGNTDVKYVNPIDVLRSTRFCKYVLGNTQQPLLVTCKERHRFMPFYTAKNMLFTNLTQALSLDRIVIKEMPTIDQQLQKENLMFQFEDKLSVRLESLKEARNVINSFLDKPSKTAILQSRAFVALAANATAQEMMEAINDPEYPNSRNIEMVDALFRIWTPESAKFVLKLVEEDVRVMPWLAFLPFVRDPSADMLLNLEPFLEIPEHRVNAIMGISGMVHNYCAGREGCAFETCVAPLLRHWEAPLAAILFKKMPRMSSKVAAFDYQGVFLGLKAVGNAGVTNNLKAIVTIILDSTNTAEIRIAALESFRRMPSLLKLACEDILGVMMKTDDDPEVRITSYFAVLKCQPQKLLEKLVFLLQFEDANEVTSFVWKHLQAESSKLPELLINRIGSIFQDGFFRAKYQMEIGNSADHVGMNKSFPAMQSTLFTDTNIIYKNGLPWVANFKAGLSMFSNRTDIIEVDAHFRDINSLLLAVVGQTGDLAMYVLGQAVDDSEERHQNNEISQPRIFETNPSFLARQLQGQISVKILGNEYYILNAYDIYLKHILHVKILMNVHSKHIKLRDTLLEWQETFLFPTASGFPFEFSMNTTAKSHLDINCGKAFKNAPSAKIDFELNTVAGISLDASGAMSLDAYILKKGLNLTVNAGIMKEFNASVHLDKDKLLSSDFSLPPSVDNRADINWSVAEVY